MLRHLLLLLFFSLFIETSISKVGCMWMIHMGEICRDRHRAISSGDEINCLLKLIWQLQMHSPRASSLHLNRKILFFIREVVACIWMSLYPSLLPSLLQHHQHHDGLTYDNCISSFPTSLPFVFFFLVVSPSHLKTSFYKLWNLCGWYHFISFAPLY